MTITEDLLRDIEARVSAGNVLVQSNNEQTIQLRNILRDIRECEVSGNAGLDLMVDILRDIKRLTRLLEDGSAVHVRVDPQPKGATKSRTERRLLPS